MNWQTFILKKITLAAVQKQALGNMDRIKGPVSLLCQGGGGDGWLSSRHMFNQSG